MLHKLKKKKSMWEGWSGMTADRLPTSKTRQSAERLQQSVSRKRVGCTNQHTHQSEPKGILEVRQYTLAKHTHTFGLLAESRSTELCS